MSIEQESLRLAPYEITSGEGGEAVLVRRDGESFTVPAAFLMFFQMCSSGTSIAELANRLRPAKGSGPLWGRFAGLARFLSFLYDCGLLVDPRMIRLAEALRADYAWRDSIAFEELFSFELVRLRGGRKAPGALAWGVVALLAVTSWISLSRLIALGGGWAELETAWPVIVSFVLAFSAGRSLRALAQFFLIRVLTGGEAALRLRLDLVSLALATDDASRGRMNGSYVAASYLNILTLAAPAVFIQAFGPFGIPPAVVGLLPFWTLLVLLADLSPFRKSALTEALRATYVHLDGRSSDESAESWIKSLHIGACVSWVVAFGLFLAFPAREFVVFTKGSDLLSSAQGIVSLGALILLQATVLVSLLDDIASGVGDGGGRDRLSIRRMWRRHEPLTLLAGEDDRRPSRQDLERLPFLRQMDPVARDLLLERATVLDGRAGAMVCRQGDDDRTLYILLSGRLAVARRTSSGRRKLIAFLEPGAVFGEVAFFIGDRRTADVDMVEDSRLLAIRHSEKLANLDRTRSEELQLRIWFLQSLVASPLFRQLPSDALDALLFAGQKKTFRAGEKVITEGEAGDACYFIIQGSASVAQNFKNINRLKAGDAFGEIALLQPHLLRTASVVADSELLTVMLDGRRFWDLLCNHLPLAVEVEKLAEERLRSDVSRRS